MRTHSHSGAPGSGMQPLSLDALLRMARGGDGRASCRLGDIYREGEGVGQDWDEAFRWYSLGASQGEPHAQNNLGTMFLRGAGCLPNEARAVFWYRKSAEQGHMLGQFNLAERYLRGEGVAPDLAEAFRWFSAAARQGDVASACRVGTMYRFGQGVERNILGAASLHVVAARGGVVAAEVELGDYLEELQDIALSGNATASWLLSIIHNLGLGVDKNQPLAWTWIKWAKERCSPPNDAGEAMGIDGAYGFYDKWMSEADRREGERVLAALLRPYPSAPRPRPLPRVRFKRRRRSGSGGERESA